MEAAAYAVSFRHRKGTDVFSSANSSVAMLWRLGWITRHWLAAHPFGPGDNELALRYFFPRLHRRIDVNDGFIAQFRAGADRRSGPQGYRITDFDTCTNSHVIFDFHVCANA
jgi:hypothetical protein